MQMVASFIVCTRSILHRIDWLSVGFWEHIYSARVFSFTV